MGTDLGEVEQYVEGVHDDLHMWQGSVTGTNQGEDHTDTLPLDERLRAQQ